MPARRFIYLLLAGFSLILAILFKDLYLTTGNKELYLSRIKENYKRESGIADEAIFNLKSKLTSEEGVSFSKLLTEDKYPVFLYANGKLIYWSHHQFDIEYEDIQGYFLEKCIQTENAIYVVKKSIDNIDNTEYEIVSLIPINFSFDIENKYLKSELNPDIFPTQGVTITLGKDLGDFQVYNNYNTYLFSVNFTTTFSYFAEKEWIILFFTGVFTIFLLLFIRRQVNSFIRFGYERLAFFFLAFSLIFLRGLMLYFKVPHRIIETNIFSSEIYSASIINPSIGDLFLNVLCISILIAFVSKNITGLISIKKLLKLNSSFKDFISVNLVILTYFSSYSIFLILEDIYFNSQITLDITSEFNFLEPVKLLCLFTFVLSVIVYFLVCNIFSKVLLKIGQSLYKITIVFVIGSLIFYAFSLFLKIENIVIFNVNAIYFASITYFNFPRFLNRTNYSTFIYLFYCALCTAIIGAYAIYLFDQTRDLENKNKYANLLLIENDPLGEFSLSQIVQKIAEDQTIKNSFISKPIDSDFIRRKVKRDFITRYFDKYDLEIRLFDEMGEPLAGIANFNTLKRIYNQKKFITDYKDVYFANELATGNNKYICLIQINRMDSTVGHLAMDFTLKKSIPNSIYPPFVDKRFEDLRRYKDYSYAIYLDDRLMYSYGGYNYDNKFLSLFEHEKGFFKTEIETDDHKHFRVPGEKNKNIIISSEKYPPKNILSNFSFLYLVLVFCMMFLVLYINYSPEKKDTISLNFSTRIQLYLNLAFFLPLIIISAIIISILSTGNQSETESFYLEKAQTVSTNIAEDILDFNNKHIDRDVLTDRVIEIAKLTQSDINLYDKAGRLLAPSQGYIFENHLLANLVNPKAFANIIEKNQAKMMLEEKVGDFNFNSAYVGIKSPENGETLGIVSVPFFGSKDKLEQQIIEVISNILQVFTLLFIILFLLSLFSVRSLTKPLVLITQKIKKVSLSGHNEPLDYHSDDEIGLLVGEYNKMILKLEESRAALARSEKETAWREMAKQVAHEIKNPLTPMKLSLQQLERVLNGSDSRAKRVITMLLDQIETLNDITTSFSSFAKMPLPQDELFELSTILKQTIALHGNSTKSIIETEIPEGEFYVNGDSKLMGRIFTNLILNGIQAVPTGKTPNISIKLNYVSQNKILIEFSDNGLGIPEHIQSKIFIPNFSTKSTGSGIGLAIAKRGIEHSGGNIWFESEIGIGTSFFIEMPLAIKPQEKEPIT
ncbi:ATP-binding protein [Chondrinema litorale]|uniref:ATP-binding protein n=1 Tax=Chondrinema litorale TaxID=2994555 RepID=UPI002543CF0D|nr:ATP-binding protein [Chondrinema litorale]UZR94182.1 ATP-binding protein [Chondrinema litorale]